MGLPHLFLFVFRHRRYISILLDEILVLLPLFHENIRNIVGVDQPPSLLFVQRSLENGIRVIEYPAYVVFFEYLLPPGAKIGNL